jgi:hypothetical protein
MLCRSVECVNSGDAMAVFINYRREDSEGDTRAIYNRLATETDESSLFLDFEAIGAGEKWRRRIDETLSKVRAVIVVIGPRWLDILKARAAAGTSDTVRSEIAAGLDKPGVHVIPVTVNGARFPDANALPEDIRGLAELNAIEVRGSTWSSDIDRLIKALRRAGALPTSRRRWVTYAAIAAIAALLATAATLFALRVEVPSIPKDMSYKYAKALVESRGLGFKFSGGGSDGGIDAVTRQHPEAGSYLFHWQSVEVELASLETYVLVCRGGDSFDALPGEDGFTLQAHDGTPSPEMKAGTCAWLDRPLRSNEANFIKPLGFDEQVPDMFRRAPLQMLAFCAKSQYAGGRSPRLVALSVTNFMMNDGGGRPVKAINERTCVDNAK